MLAKEGVGSSMASGELGKWKTKEKANALARSLCEGAGKTEHLRKQI